MKKFMEKYAGMLAAVALLVTTYTVNSAYIFVIHQEPLPERAKKLRRF